MVARKRYESGILTVTRGSKETKQPSATLNTEHIKIIQVGNVWQLHS